MSSRPLLRFLAAAGVLVVALYPVQVFLTLAGVPLPVRLLWPLVTALAIGWPWPSMLAFVAASPVLPMLPSLLRWPRVSLGEMWLFALLAAALLRAAAGRREARCAVPLAQPLLLVLVTSSLLVTMYPFHASHGGLAPLVARVHEFCRGDLWVTVSQRHLFAPILAWLTMAEGLVLLWLVASEIGVSARDRAVELLVAATVGAVAVAGYGIAQRWTGWNLLLFWLEQDPNLFRINATFSDVNSLGAYLAMTLWIAVAVSRLQARAVWRGSWLAGASAIGLALVFTSSRAAWVAATIGGGFCLLSMQRARVFRAGSWLASNAKRLVMAMSLVLVVVLAALTAWATIVNAGHVGQRNPLDTVLYTLNLNTPLHYRLRGRPAMWDAAVRMVADRPVFGVGIGRYYKEAYAYAPRPEALIRPQENAHNYFLQVAAELGLTGGLALVALFAAGLLSARRAERTAGIDTRIMAVGAGTAIATFAVAQLGGHSLLLREAQFAFWPIVAVALAAARVPGTASAAEPGADAGSARRRWRFLAAASVVIAVSVPFRLHSAFDRIAFERVSEGLYDPETSPDGSVFRWTAGRAVVYVPADASDMVLRVRSVAPFPQQVVVRVDDHAAGGILLEDHAWRRLRYLMPRTRDGLTYRRVQLTVSPCWTPPDDPRTLGVMLGDVRWTR